MKRYFSNAWIVLSILPLLAGRAGAEGGAVDVVGMLGGRIVDRSSHAPLGEMTVEARLLTTGERFEATTDSAGTFFVSRLPAGMYAFRISDDGATYDVDEVFDVRVGMPFVLESCFEVDAGAKRAYRAERDCRTPFVPEARVVTLGAQRFLVPEPFSSDRIQSSTALPTIEHEPLECMPGDEFPMLNAEIEPWANVQLARLFFRAAQHPDLYFVDMSISHEDGKFYGVLPKASADTTSIHYYVEAIDRAFDSVRTEEFVAVVETAGECQRRAPIAWFTGSNPGIVVNAVSPGAPAVPAGFQAVGISAFVSSAGIVTSATAAGGAVGGGLATPGVLLVLGGAAAATRELVVAATSDVEASPPDQ